MVCAHLIILASPSRGARCAVAGLLVGLCGVRGLPTPGPLVCLILGCLTGPTIDPYLR